VKNRSKLSCLRKGHQDEVFFSFCFEGKAGTDESGRSKKLQEERKKQTPFLAKQ
jgi:hypothetical protein